MTETEKCPECEEMQKSHKDYCVWCGNYKDDNGSEGVKIPVISMEDVPKIAKEMEKMKKVMISQPMSGLNDAAIKETRRKATEKLRKEGYEVADSYFTEEWIALNAGGIKNKLCRNGS